MCGRWTGLAYRGQRVSREQLQLRSAVRCVHLRSTSQCLLCLATDRNHHNDHGEWCLAAALRLWHLLPHHDNYHRNIDHAQPLSWAVPISLEHR